MATTPDTDVRDFLNTNIADLTTGTNLWNGPVRDEIRNPGQLAVFCLATGGLQPEPFRPDDNDVHQSSVQVTILSACANQFELFEAGQTMARSVRDTLSHATISGYIGVVVLEAEPNYLGREVDRGPYRGAHRWSVNVLLRHQV